MTYWIWFYHLLPFVYLSYFNGSCNFHKEISRWTDGTTVIQSFKDSAPYEFHTLITQIISHYHVLSDSLTDK